MFLLYPADCSLSPLLSNEFTSPGCCSPLSQITGNGGVTLYQPTLGFQHILPYLAFTMARWLSGEDPLFLFLLSNQKGRRLTGLLGVAQLVRGRAKIRIEVFRLLVQDSSDTLNSESRGSLVGQCPSRSSSNSSTCLQQGSGGPAALKGDPIPSGTHGSGHRSPGFVTALCGEELSLFSHLSGGSDYFYHTHLAELL